jgi:hypothetical protein
MGAKKKAPKKTDVERRAPMKRGLKPARNTSRPTVAYSVERRAPMKRGLKRGDPSFELCLD